jgi:hypothetical protein
MSKAKQDEQRNTTPNKPYNLIHVLEESVRTPLGKTQRKLNHTRLLHTFLPKQNPLSSFFDKALLHTLKTLSHPTYNLTKHHRHHELVCCERVGERAKQVSRQANPTAEQERAHASGGRKPEGGTLA